MAKKGEWGKHRTSYSSLKREFFSGEDGGKKVGSRSRKKVGVDVWERGQEVKMEVGRGRTAGRSDGRTNRDNK